jgi:hypothetical protein
MQTHCFTTDNQPLPAIGKRVGSASGFWHISIACNRPLTPPSPRERGEGEQLLAD